MVKDFYHVVRDLEGGWSVRRKGARRASKHFANRQDAIEWGRDISRRHGLELFIHKWDGSVERAESPS